MLGRITARIDAVAGGPARRHVVTSADRGRDGRKFHAVSAVRDDDGGLCAVARATWIQLRARRPDRGRALACRR